MAGNFKLAVGLAVGCILGARAGRERYERLAELAREVAQRPEARQLTDRARSGLAASVNQAIGTAGDRLERARTAMAPTSAKATASPEPRTESAAATEHTDEETREHGRPPSPGSSSPAGRRERRRNGR
jgi:hypothetical protein